MSELSDSDEVMLAAHKFWNTGGNKQARFAHHLGTKQWPGKRWNQIGIKHLAMAKEGLEKYGDEGAVGRLLEWGPGGGSNIVHFSDIFDHATGVDISVDSLQACAKACSDIGLGDYFHPFPIAIDDPCRAMDLSEDPFDFLLCTAVIQHMPSIEHFRKVFSLWRKLLRPGALALVQFRTNHHSRPCHRKPGGSYNANVARWLMFEVPMFSEWAEEAGWDLLEFVGDGKPTRSGYVFAWLRNP